MSKLASVLTLMMLAAGALRADSADEIVAQHLAARGGEARIRSVRSLRFSGTISSPHGGDIPLRFEWRRPDAVRIEATIQGMTMIQAFDGERGWLVMPMMGSDAPQQASEEDLGRLRRSAEFDGPLLDAAARGIRVELVGRESFEGTPADHLRVTRPDGEVVDLFLDAESHLLICESGTSVERGFEARYSVTFGDFREVDGLVVPFERARRVEGMPAAQVTSVDSLELDVELPDERFAMPASAGGR